MVRTIGPVTVDLQVRIVGERRRRFRTWLAICLFTVAVGIWPGTTTLEVQ